MQVGVVGRFWFMRRISPHLEKPSRSFQRNETGTSYDIWFAQKDLGTLPGFANDWGAERTLKSLIFMTFDGHALRYVGSYVRTILPNHLAFMAVTLVARGRLSLSPNRSKRLYGQLAEWLGKL